MESRDPKEALLYEASVRGHVEADTPLRERAARELVAEGKLVLAGELSERMRPGGPRICWYLAPVG